MESVTENTCCWDPGPFEKGERSYLLCHSAMCCACLQRRQYFPRDGSRNTPPHPSCDFGWKDYCPAAFRKLRDVFSIDRADFMTSICGGFARIPSSDP